MTNEEKGAKLLEIVEKFVKDQTIYCEKSVFQSDRVIENAYEIIASMCEVVATTQAKPRNNG